MNQPSPDELDTFPDQANDATDNFLGRLQGIVTIAGDIESPVEPVESWHVLRD